VSCVDCGNDQLAETTDEHSVDEEDSATTPFGDDAAIDNDDHDSDGGQDTIVHEWRSDLGHLEEVCSVGCNSSAAIHDYVDVGIRTDHIHGTRSSLKSNSTNSKQCSTTINWVAPEVNNLRVHRKKLLSINRSFHFGEFGVNEFWERPQP
jgi:hypothetical protein